MKISTLTFLQDSQKNNTTIYPYFLPINNPDLIISQRGYIHNFSQLLYLKHQNGWSALSNMSFRIQISQLPPFLCAHLLSLQWRFDVWSIGHQKCQRSFSWLRSSALLIPTQQVSMINDTQELIVVTSWRSTHNEHCLPPLGTSLFHNDINLKMFRHRSDLFQAR